MTRFAMGTWTFIFPPYEDKPEEFDGILDRAAEIGFDGVEVGWFEPHPAVADLQTPESRAAYKAKFTGRGLDLAGVVANFDGCDILGSDDNSQYMAALDAQIELCADLGIGVLRLDLPDAPEVMDTLDYDAAYERLIKTWTEAARRGGEKGVKIGWEFEPGTPFNKPSEIFRIVDDITEPAFGVIYDTTQGHNCAMGNNQRGEVETLERGQIEFLERLKGKIIHIHLIDSNGELFDDRFSRHIPFGQGDVDWETVMPALVAARADDASDWWTIDVCWWEDAWPVFEQGLEFVKDLQEKYDG